MPEQTPPLRVVDSPDAQPLVSRVKAACANLVQSDKEMSCFLDDHWKKLRLLVGLLHQEEADNSAIGSLLADVAESFITQIEAFDRAPASAKLQVIDELVSECEVRDA